MYTPIPMKRSTKYGNNYWEAFSFKMNRDVCFFSDLEYDHWILTECNLQIVSFCEQPKRIKVEWQGEWTESVFDMWTKDKEKNEKFIEVKYSFELDPVNPRFSPRSYKQTQAQRKWCEEQGFAYEIQTENEIRSNMVYLDNLKTMISHIRQRPYMIDTISHQISKVLSPNPIPIAEIEHLLSNIKLHLLYETLYFMIFHNNVQSNIATYPLSSKTEVWINA